MTSKCVCHLNSDNGEPRECVFCTKNKLTDETCPALSDEFAPCEQCGLLADDLNKDGYCGECVFAGRVNVE